MFKQISKKITILSISKKFFISAFAPNIFLYYLSISRLFSKVKNNTIKNYEDIVNQQIYLINKQIEIFNDSMKYSADKFMNLFKSLLPDDLSYADNGICDRFSEITEGSVANVFKRDGSDFVRIATSLKKEDGQRALFTKLEHTHPAYKLLLNGKTFAGKATLFNKDYMTKYVPIKNQDDDVEYVLFIGFYINNQIEQIKSFLRSVKVGDTGYIYVIDMSEKNKGQIMIHPYQEGENLLTDYSNFGFIKELLSKKEGRVKYNWSNINTKEKHKRYKVAIFKHYDEFQWIIASTYYIDEINKKSNSRIKDIEKSLIISSVFSLFLTSVLTFSTTRFLSSSIKEIITQIKTLYSGKVDLTNRLDVKSHGELGLLAYELNKLIDAFKQLYFFKKKIEKDKTVEDIYVHLGELFEKELGFKCIIKIPLENGSLEIVYPKNKNDYEEVCDTAVILNADLCEAKKANKLISSVDNKNWCKYCKKNKEYLSCCIPIAYSDEVSAVVQVLYTKNHENEDKINNNINKVRQYIIESQPIIKSKRLERILKDAATKDSLTGLYNRKFIDGSLDIIVQGVKRRGNLIGVLMCDIDHFKEINDNYGHDAGDLVLKKIAVSIAKSVRNSDIVVRIGGEEFLVLLLDIKKKDYVLIAEQIRKNIEKMSIKINENQIKRTISVGIAEYDTKKEENVSEIIKFADTALYKAKNSGRNRVVTFDTLENKRIVG